MDDISISLPARPLKKEAPAEPPAPLNFITFVDAAAELLKTVGGRVEQRGQNEEGVSWWLSFIRASCLYRFACDRRTDTLVFEKGFGSFVPVAQPIWRALDSRPYADGEFESALPLMKEMLGRFIRL